MQNAATKADEQNIFERAVRDFTARPGSRKPIAAMMRLSTEAISPSRRRWAGEWLFKHCNVRVDFGAVRGNSDAAPSTAASLR